MAGRKPKPTALKKLEGNPWARMLMRQVLLQRAIQFNGLKLRLYQRQIIYTDIL